GFLRIFAAWVLDGDLPWTTGGSNMLADLFRYLKILYALPSDTAVWNELVKIFAELHSKVVEELAFAFATDMWTNKQMIYTFACSIALFIDNNWALVEHVINFWPLESKEHEGIYATHSFVDSACKAGVLSKMSLLI
ncbi:hypothetical protein BDQ17DRAFT_1245977, partial [Cyathus striatus]